MINITFTQNNEIFNKFNVPHTRCCHQWFNLKQKFPFNIEFEKTYYKYDGKGLVAFRILGYTIDDSDYSNYKLSYLVQLPNQAPKWESDFITTKTNVYSSVEDYVMSGGSQFVNLGWADIMTTQQVSTWHGYSDRFFFKGTFYTIKNGAVCESKGHYCNRIFVTKNGWLVGISKRNLNNYEGENGVYLHKADAMRVLLDNMEIMDFAEPPINIDITILPNTPKITKLQFID
jgi:hypothetical protein